MGKGILNCNWKNNWNVGGVIDLGVKETKPFNEKFTFIIIWNFIILYPVLEIINGFKIICTSIYTAASQCLNQTLVIWSSLVSVLNIWTHNKKRKRKTPAQMSKSYWIQLRKSVLTETVYSKTLSGKPDIIRHMQGPCYICICYRDHQIFSAGFTTHSDSHDLNRSNLALGSLRRILYRKQHDGRAFIFYWSPHSSPRAILWPLYSHDNLNTRGQEPT